MGRAVRIADHSWPGRNPDHEPTLRRERSRLVLQVAQLPKSDRQVSQVGAAQASDRGNG